MFRPPTGGIEGGEKPPIGDLVFADFLKSDYVGPIKNLLHDSFKKSLKIRFLPTLFIYAPRRVYAHTRLFKYF